jgi:hypothetical protein
VKDGKIVKVAGLKSPFDIVIDDQNRVWVANSQADFVTRFPADDPSKAETFPAGISVRGLALDSKGNVWVGGSFSHDFPMPKVPDGATIMEQFQLMGVGLYRSKTSTGVVNLIRSDGTQPAYDPKAGGFTGGGLVDSPWGLNIDGNDDVWVANIGAVKNGVVLMAGVDSKWHPAGTKTGDVIHLFQSGSLQLLTDTSIDPAGNVWAANNWNSFAVAMDPDPARRTSTWGGGSNFTVIYGVAAPVLPPRMGKVRKLPAPILAEMIVEPMKGACATDVSRNSSFSWPLHALQGTTTRQPCPPTLVQKTRRIRKRKRNCIPQTPNRRNTSPLGPNRPPRRPR